MRTENRYPSDHWVRVTDREKALRSYLVQQNKAYSRVKNAFIRELLGDLRHKRFLDYGCGAGMFLRHAAASEASVIVGVDREESVLATARYFLEKEGLGESCRWVVANRFPALSAESRFDAVLLKDVVEHVADDQSLLNAAAKAIAAKGRVVISTQNALSLNFLIEGTIQRLIRRRKDWCGWDPTHLRFYTPDRLKKKMETAGLKVVTWRSIYLIPHKIPIPYASGRQFYRIESLTRIDSLLGRFFPWNRLGWNILVMAVK